MEKHQPTVNLIQGGAAIGELAERKIWKERLREEILEEEKERIMNFVESEITKKLVEIEKLLEIGGKPAKLVVLPKDHAHVPKLWLPLEQDIYSSLSHHLVNTGKGKSSSAPATLVMDADIKGGSKLGLNLVKDYSAENSMIPVEEVKADEILQASEGEQHLRLRPTKKQKTGCKWSCPLCGVTATSETNLNKHFMGKKHKIKSLKAQRALKSDREETVAVKEIPANGLPMKMQANGKLFVVYKKGNILWCNNNNCNFTCVNTAEMVLHLTGPEHEVCENGEERVKVASKR